MSKRPICLILLFALTRIHHAEAQTLPQAPPQTARRAPLEMFTATKPGALEKHLPDVTRKALVRGGDAPNSEILRQFSNFSAGLAANRNRLRTFDEGPILLSMGEEQAQQKLEILVERDDLQGDTDEIELSLRSYKQRLLEPLPVVPRLTFSLKQEKEVWKLNDIALSLRLPLADPESLKEFQKSQNSAFESSALASVRTLNTAEISYAASFPERRFTCTVSELGGRQRGVPKPEHAMLIDDNLASGKKSAYIFSITGCDARPASKYQVAAVPADSESGMRAFCSDESAVVRYAADGKAVTCLNEGQPLQ